jgi:epsilon-lactone hydrolase
LRAKLARLALRWLIKRHGRRQSLARSRREFAAMERIIPKPPAGVRTDAVDAGGVRADLIVTPRSRADRHVLYLHGGAYRMGAPSTYRHFTWRIADAAQARLLAIDYRLAPEHPFPAALDDAVAAYRWLLKSGIDARTITVMGDSAGGGLALALLLKLRDDRLPLCAAAVALSPWTDLGLTGPSLTLNAQADPMLNSEDLPRYAADYLCGANPSHPYASPLYGDPSRLPPILIHVGSDEILRDDAVRMAARLQEAKSAVELEVWPRMPHVWHLLAPFLPEAKTAIGQIGEFIDRAMPPPAASFGA